MSPRIESVAPTGTEAVTLYVAIEISRKSWVVGLKSPLGDRIGVHTIGAADVGGLAALMEHHRAKAERVLSRPVRAVLLRGWLRGVLAGAVAGANRVGRHGAARSREPSG